MDETAAEAHLHRSLQQAREAVPWKLDGLGEYDARRDAETPRRRDAETPGDAREAVPPLTARRYRARPVRRPPEHLVGVTLNPYLHFDGEASEAIAFYADVLGGTTSVMTFGQMGMEGPDAEKVMHGQLETPHGITLMVSDMPPGSTRERGNDITISLSGDDEPTLRGFYEQLSASGEVGTPLEKQMWGDLYGDCTDRFGIRWLVNIAQQG